LVLRDNYDQTRVLSFAQAAGVRDLDAHERFIETLEKEGRLNRKVEGLPSLDEMTARRDRAEGLTRPELSVLLAYSKLNNARLLQSSDLPDDPHFWPALKAYFPKACAPFEQAMRDHRLRREIITMALGNGLIDLGGPILIKRVGEESGAGYEDVVRALEAVRKIFRLDEFMDAVDAIDGPATAAVQIALQGEAVRVLSRAGAWLAGRLHAGLAQRPISPLIAHYQPGVDAFASMVSISSSNALQVDIKRRADEFMAAGAPDALAMWAAGLRPLSNALDVLELAKARNWASPETARMMFAVGETFGFAEMRAGADTAKADQHWDRLALRKLREELFAMQLDFAGAAMRDAESRDVNAAAKVVDPVAALAFVETWRAGRGARAGRVNAALDDIRGSGAWTLGKLTLAAAQLRTLNAA